MELQKLPGPGRPGRQQNLQFSTVAGAATVSLALARWCPESYSPRSWYTGPGWLIGDVTSGLLLHRVTRALRHRLRGLLQGKPSRHGFESNRTCWTRPDGRQTTVLPVYSVDTRAACSLQPSHGFWTLDILNRDQNNFCDALLVRSIDTLHSFIILHVLLTYKNHKEFNPNE